MGSFVVSLPKTNIEIVDTLEKALLHNGFTPEPKHYDSTKSGYGEFMSRVNGDSRGDVDLLIAVINGANPPNDLRVSILHLLDTIATFWNVGAVSDELFQKYIVPNPFVSFIYEHVGQNPNTDRKLVKTLEQALLVNNWTEWRYSEFLNLPWWRNKTKEEQKLLEHFTDVISQDVSPSEELKHRINIYLDQLLSERGVRCTKALRTKFLQES